MALGGWLRLAAITAGLAITWQTGVFIYGAGANAEAVQQLKAELTARNELDQLKARVAQQQAAFQNRITEITDELHAAQLAQPSDPACLRPAGVVRQLIQAGCAAGSESHACRLPAARAAENR